jgi:hypothetical protein
MRPAKKLPSSPQKKQDAVKAAIPRPGAMTVPSKGVKHALDQDDTKPRTANYTAAGKPMGQLQHGAGQDIKRRRTDEAEDKDIITSKPMRVSVVKQVPSPTSPPSQPRAKIFDFNRRSNRRNRLANQFVIHIQRKRKRRLKFLLHINICFLQRVSWPPSRASNSPTIPSRLVNPPPVPHLKPNDLVHLNLKHPRLPHNNNNSRPTLPANPSFSLKLTLSIPPSCRVQFLISRYSDSEDDSPKKPTIVKPAWAESPILIAQLKRQQMINPDDVFGEIKPPAIDDIFRNNNRRGHSTFRPRSSSANWSGQDKLTKEEIEEYAKTMGYAKP